MAPLIRRRLWGVASLVIAVLVVLVHVRQVRRAAASRSFGRYTAQQMVDRTQSLCQMLDMPSDSLQYHVQPFTLAARNGGDDRYWEVECLGNNRSYVGQFVWNADTGELRSFSHSVLPALASLSPPMNRRQAVIMGWSWLSTLQTGRSDSSWQLTRSTKRDGLSAGWWFSYKTASERVTVMLDACYGQLVYYQVSPLKVPSV